MKVTWFQSAKDNVGEPWEGTWPEFIETIRGVLAESAVTKTALPAFGAYALNGTRCNASVTAFSALVFDLDDLPEGPEALFSALASERVAALVYETPGSTATAARL